MTAADKINLAIAIATGASTLVSLLVAVITLKILQTNRATIGLMQTQLEASTRPYIEIAPTLDKGGRVVMLTVRNSGASAARKVRLLMDRDFFFNGEANHNIREYSAFTKVIDALAPRAELTFMLGVGYTIFRQHEMCPKQFSVNAEYECGGKHFSEQNSIDLEPFRGVASVKDPLIEALDSISTSIEKTGRQ